MREGRIVPPGTPGELCTRGYSVMRGYWDDEEKTAEAIDPGRWMHTGDLATIDEEGYCNIVGRIKDMVIRGGENIYPREIEEFLYTHPEGRATCKCSACPTRNMARSCAPGSSSRPIRPARMTRSAQFCQGQIAHYKIPRYVRFVDAFPMTVTGKIQKYLMREQARKELGLEEEKTA